MLECDEWTDLYRSVSYGAELGNFGGEGFSGIFCMGLKGIFGVFFANSSVEQLDVENSVSSLRGCRPMVSPTASWKKYPGLARLASYF